MHDHLSRFDARPDTMPGDLTALFKPRYAAACAKRTEQYLGMARAVQGLPFSDWPGWSTGEKIMVALILDRFDVLQALGYSMLEAVERADLFTVAELRSIRHWL